MDKSLSETLLGLGFFSVLGTVQHGHREGSILVLRGIPNSWDQNQGIFVVYDENGWPWIKRANKVSLEVRSSLDKEMSFNLKKGAHVPHSNDGGTFIEILENLSTNPPS